MPSYALLMKPEPAPMSRAGRLRLLEDKLSRTHHAVQLAIAAAQRLALPFSGDSHALVLNLSDAETLSYVVRTVERTPR